MLSHFFSLIATIIIKSLWLILPHLSLSAEDNFVWKTPSYSKFYRIMDCVRNVFAKLETPTCIKKLVAKVKPLKDQILFVVFQLIFYIFDIGSDTYQAYVFRTWVPKIYIIISITFQVVSFYSMVHRTGHPKRAWVTMFWVFCPMLVKLILDTIRSVKDFCKCRFSLFLCGCEKCEVSYSGYYLLNLHQITEFSYRRIIAFGFNGSVLVWMDHSWCIFQSFNHLFIGPSSLNWGNMITRSKTINKVIQSLPQT